jgi:hypothetical protein
MNQLMLSQEEGAFRAAGVACQSASHYYEAAVNVTEGEWQAFARKRAAAYADAAKRITELLKRDEVLPGSPDADMEWLKQIALRAQAAISGDEAGTLLKSFARTERKVWDAVGELGQAGVSPAHGEAASDLAKTVMDGFLWLGKEKQAFLENGN